MSLPWDGRNVTTKKSNSVMYDWNNKISRTWGQYYVIQSIFLLLTKCTYDQKERCYYWAYTYFLLRNKKLRYYIFWTLIIGLICFTLYRFIFTNEVIIPLSIEVSKFINQNVIDDECIDNSIEKTLKNLPIIEFSRDFLYGRRNFHYITEEDVEHGYTTLFLKQTTFQGDVKIAFQTMMSQATTFVNNKNMTDICICFIQIGVPLSGGILKRQGVKDFVFINATWTSHSSNTIHRMYSQEERQYYNIPEYGKINYLTLGSCSLSKNIVVDMNSSPCVVMCGGIF